MKIRQTIASIYIRCVNSNAARRFVRETVSANGKTALVVGTPIYGNYGDSAISLAQMDFLRETLPPEYRVAEITYSDYYRYRRELHSAVRQSTVLFCMGGGNMGNQWIREEQLRYDVLSDYPKNRVIVFPQTVFFSESGDPNYTQARSQVVYNGRQGLTLVAREPHSFDTMRELYADTEVLMVPDIVLYATMERFGAAEQSRSGVLFCSRSDVEKTVSDGTWENLAKKITSMGKQVYRTEMDVDGAITKENRRERVREKMQEFCGAELVITDRLHGMVFAALTGTPCIVFSNYNHKVKGTYDWISYLPYIKYADTADQAEGYIPELLKMENCKYDNTLLRPYFDKLKEVVIEACR